MPRFTSEDDAADVAVVGLGPGGLMAALCAAQQGKKVVAFTDRSQYLRTQLLELTSNSLGLLKQFYDSSDTKDVKFWRQLTNNETIQIKDVERYLHRKLLKQPSVKIVQLNKESNSIKALGISESDKANFIKTQDGKHYYFHNLVEADGARRSLVTLANRDLNLGINYQDAREQEKHPYHATVELKLKVDASSERVKPQWEIISRMQTLQAMGWNKAYQPKRFIYTNHEKNKFYYAGEIPQAIFAAPASKRPALLKRWAAKMIQEKYGVQEEQLEFSVSKKTPMKDAIRTTVFKMGIKRSNKSVSNLANGVLVQIGDARRNPNYMLGHGINDAMAAAAVFVDCLKSSPFNQDKFTQIMLDMDYDVIRRMRNMRLEEQCKVYSARNELNRAMDALIDRLKRFPEKKCCAH